MVLAQSTSLTSSTLANSTLVSRNAAALSQPDPATQAKVAESYGKLPLSFETNHGQADSRVKFLSRTSGYSLFLTGDEAVLALSGKEELTSGAEVRIFGWRKWHPSASLRAGS
jgi:hypothetical protein